MRDDDVAKVTMESVLPSNQNNNGMLHTHHPNPSSATSVSSAASVSKQHISTTTAEPNMNTELTPVA